LQENTTLENGEKDEVESLFHTCGGIVERKRSEEKEVNHDFKFLIDHFLWDFRREVAKEILEKKLPCHKTFSVFLLICIIHLTTTTITSVLSSCLAIN
jgi:hypothetical protein